MLAAALSTALVACHRGADTVSLLAPFNEETELGEVSATWTRTGEDRTFADGEQLKAPQVKLQYRVAVHSRLAGALYVSLGGLELLDREGAIVAADDASRECAAGSGTTPDVLVGEVWVPAEAADRIRGFRLRHFAVPLREPGRALYREWRLRGQPQGQAEVDAEIARYVAAPPCTTH